MVNRQKIIIMTRLAIYDKHQGEADRTANEYFRHDYIYRKNIGTRISAGLGSLILLVIYWLRELFTGSLEEMAANLQKYITDSVLFMLAMLAVYSLIGTVLAAREYYLSQRRLEKYKIWTAQLERINERVRRQSETDNDRYI